MVKIKKSFIITLISLCIIFDYKQVSLFMLALVLNQLCQILFGLKFGLSLKNITFNTFSIDAKMTGINKLSFKKRIIFTLSGVSLNLLIFLIILFLNTDKSYILSFKFYNFILAVFNLLPIYPLVGSKLYIYIRGYFIGFLNASKEVLKVGKIFCIFIIVLGFLQTVLFPFNIFIYVVGVYLHRKPKDTIFSEMFLDFYQSLPEKYKSKNVYKIKHVLVAKDTTLGDILNKISLEKYIISTIEINGTLSEISEKKLYNYTKAFPLTEKLHEIEKVKNLLSANLTYLDS